MVQAATLTEVSLIGFGSKEYGWVEEDRPWQSVDIDKIADQYFDKPLSLPQRAAQKEHLQIIMATGRAAKMDDVKRRSGSRPTNRSTATKKQLANLAQALRAITVEETTPATRTYAVQKRLTALDDTAWGHLEFCLLDDPRVLQSRCLPTSPAGAASIELPLLLDVVESAFGKLHVGPGSPRNATDRRLVTSLMGLWPEITNAPARRGSDPLTGEDTGTFLEFCRAVIRLVEIDRADTPSVTTGHWLSKIVRNVIGEASQK